MRSSFCGKDRVKLQLVRRQETRNLHKHLVRRQETRNLGLPRCKNLTRFSLFVSFCFAVQYCLKCFCFLCFTSSVSFTGSYTEVKPEICINTLSDAKRHEIDGSSFCRKGRAMPYAKLQNEDPRLTSFSLGGRGAHSARADFNEL